MMDASKPQIKSNLETFPQHIFRAYDIRGVVGQTLTPDGVYQIGQAIGTEAEQRGQQTVVVARLGPGIQNGAAFSFRILEVLEHREHERELRQRRFEPSLEEHPAEEGSEERLDRALGEAVPPQLVEGATASGSGPPVDDVLQPGAESH